MKNYNYLVILFLFFGAFSCKRQTGNLNDEISTTQETDTLDYAKGFSILEKDNYKLVTIKNPWQGAENIEYKYALIKEGEKVPNLEQQVNVIRTPVKKVICLSTTHIAFLGILDETQSIVAVSGCNYVNNQKVRKRIASKKVYDVGYDNSLNYELIASLKPDLVITYGVGGQIAGYNQKLNDLGIKTIIVAEYLENDPLGKLEWIKLLGEFYNKRVQADQYFNNVKDGYNKLKSLVDSIEYRPKILFGLPWKDTWHVPGGNSYLAKMVEDAGGEYIWKEDKSRESIPFGIESIFSQASDADIWLNTGTINNREDILKIDERFIDFKPFLQSKIYNNNLRVNQYGGNDYWEKGLVQPNILLKDMIKIFHPNILPDYKLVYYKNIQ